MKTTFSYITFTIGLCVSLKASQPTLQGKNITHLTAEVKRVHRPQRVGDFHKGQIHCLTYTDGIVRCFYDYINNHGQWVREFVNK